MTKYEKQTDFIIGSLLEEAGLDFTFNGSKIKEVEEALKTASKRGTGKQGFPEFVALSGEYLIVIEDKADPTKQVKYVDPNNPKTLLMDRSSVTDYAENGAVFYARHIVENTRFKKVFAFGCSGTERGRMNIRPIFVSPKMIMLLPKVQDFSEFIIERINAYYQRKVLNSKPVEQVELEQIISRAAVLHEDLRNYGNLGDTEKPLVVSALLLALANTGFHTEMLTGNQDNGTTDGDKVMRYLSDYLTMVQVQPQVKKDQVLDQFRIVKNRPILSAVNSRLGKTPLRYFAEYLDSNVLTAIRNNHPEDVLGRFYGEFISYSGGDGQSLGVVLTPKHITELFCELVDIKPTDKVLDPTCGTGGFLIAALSNMLNQVDEQCEAGKLSLKQRDELKKTIRKNNLFGFELRDDMFSIATTNMILRGDGKSNLICDDFLAQSTTLLQQNGCTVGMMNPPYSQAKNKATEHLSELKFIIHLLDSLAEGARCAIIVPQSTMVGKSKMDKQDKVYILEHHTLEGVITLNPQTFYGVGTNPVIAVFTAHQPHPKRKYARFIDFKDDGFVVYPHLGLLPTIRADERHQLLIDCWRHNKPVLNNFMVQSTVEAGDEWLHSFYYFDETIPVEDDFQKTMADYLSFEFSMITHGRGYLFEKEEAEEEPEKVVFVGKKWQTFFMDEVFDIRSSVRLTKDDMIAGNRPFVGASDSNNGVTAFVSNTNSSLDSNVLGVNYNGSVVDNFYHPYEAIFSDDVKRLHFKNYKDDKYAYLFVKQAILQQKSKFEYGYKFNGERMKRQQILLPVTISGEPDYAFMSAYMRRMEYEMRQRYLDYLEHSINHIVQ